MEHKLKCQNCKGSFKSKRVDTKFCSPSCKQQAYYRRNDGISDEYAQTKEIQESIFYMDEYELTEYNQISFIEYCFLRKSLVKNASIEQIDKYIGSLFSDNNNMDDLLEINLYKIFLRDFLEGNFIVHTNRFIDGKDTLNKI